MEKQKAKKNGRIRYDNAFKQGAISMIVDQHMPIKEVSQELQVSTDSLRTWLKNAGLNPNSENKENNQAKRIRELEDKLKAAQKQLQLKDEVISILKKSIGIICQ